MRCIEAYFHRSLPFPISIAIDGPAASGKSTTSKGIADRLGLLYIDTGAMYRSFTWKTTLHKLRCEEVELIATLLDQTEIKLDYRAGILQVKIDDKDVTISTVSMFENYNYNNNYQTEKLILQLEYPMSVVTVYK